MIEYILDEHRSLSQPSLSIYYPGIWAVVSFAQTTAKADREIKQLLSQYIH
jgi:hypothetical protein